MIKCQTGAPNPPFPLTLPPQIEAGRDTTKDEEAASSARASGSLGHGQPQETHNPLVSLSRSTAPRRVGGVAAREAACSEDNKKKKKARNARPPVPSGDSRINNTRSPRPTQTDSAAHRGCRNPKARASPASPVECSAMSMPLQSRERGTIAINEIKGLGRSIVERVLMCPTVQDAEKKVRPLQHRVSLLETGKKRKREGKCSSQEVSSNTPEPKPEAWGKKK